MRDEESSSRKYWALLLLLIWGAAGQAWVIWEYVSLHTGYLPLFFAFCIALPAISIVAYFWIGYKGRPINAGANNPLPIDPVHAGYQSHEFDD